jgi:ABC-type sugar transport system permease subunit
VISNTLINTPLIVIFSLFVAMLLNRDFPLRGFFRGAFFLPALIGTGYIMQELLAQGVEEQTMNIATAFVLPEGVAKYIGPFVATSIRTFLERIAQILWRSGIQILLFLAGLQGIPGSLYESAVCDGATEWEKFWKITVPMLAPVIVLTTIFTLVESFTDIINPIVDYIVERAFGDLQFEYAAAISWIYCGLIFVLVFLIYIFRRAGAE